jgi:hypothetical protein
LLSKFQRNGVRVSRLELGALAISAPDRLIDAPDAPPARSSKLIMVDPREDRLQAKPHGRDVTIQPTQCDARPDAVRDGWEGGCRDRAARQRRSRRRLSRCGRCMVACVVGALPHGCASVLLDTNAIHYGNCSVTGSTGGSADYRIARAGCKRSI